jgi:hypothetical protein
MDRSAATTINKIIVTKDATRVTRLSEKIGEAELASAPRQVSPPQTTNLSPSIKRPEDLQGFPGKTEVPTETLPETLQGSWTKIARANMSVILYADLVRVARLASGWAGLDTQPLRPKSLQNFLEFWTIVREVAAEPEVTLAPDGSLHAEWFKSPQQRLDVKFADQKAFFGLLTNNSILEGVDELHTVAQILMLHRARPLSWTAR